MGSQPEREDERRRCLQADDAVYPPGGGGEGQRDLHLCRRGMTFRISCEALPKYLRTILTEQQSCNGSNLRGKVPFEDNHLQGDKMSKNIRAGERPLFPSQCPKYFTNLTRRCWHSDPAQRCRVLRYIKQFLVMNPDQCWPDMSTPPVDYFDTESSLSKIVSNWARRDDPRVWEVPFQMYAYRVLERENTGANMKDSTSDSRSEGASICGDENAFNGILDDTLSNSSDSVKLSLESTPDRNKKAPTKLLNGKAYMPPLALLVLPWLLLMGRLSVKIQLMQDWMLPQEIA